MNMRHTRPAGFLILVASASLAAAQDNMRFRGMDRNNDGKIARAEWHGSDRSFRNHDWNGDGVLSGDEVRVTGRRPLRSGDWDLDGIIDREEELTAERFRNLDHNGDGRLSSNEWHADLASFRRLDRDRNGLLGPEEFSLGGMDVDLEDRSVDLDHNGDGRVTIGEWHGTREVFTWMDTNHDGVLSRAEIDGESLPLPAPPVRDRFASIDVNHDGRVSLNEWHWGDALFNRIDADRDGSLTRREWEVAMAARPDTTRETSAYRVGYARGLEEGRMAGREDLDRRQGWDLEGQRELEQADSGYNAGLGARTEYQAGYRTGFRIGYRDGYGPPALSTRATLGRRLWAVGPA